MVKLARLCACEVDRLSSFLKVIQDRLKEERYMIFTEFLFDMETLNSLIARVSDKCGLKSQYTQTYYPLIENISEMNIEEEGKERILSLLDELQIKIFQDLCKEEKITFQVAGELSEKEMEEFALTPEEQQRLEKELKIHFEEKSPKKEHIK